MKLRIKGNPYIYTHECTRDEAGRPLTKSEMHDFVTDCLIKSFEMRGTEVIRHTPDFNSNADFSFTKLGKTICGVVKYGLSDEEQKDLVYLICDKCRFKETYPQLLEGFHKYNSYPIFYIASARCLDSDSGIPIAGGRFEISWEPLQALYPKIPTSGPNISEYEMYKGYANSWETGDTSFLKDYVNSYFTGESELSFDSITCKEELLAWVKSQHEKWETRHLKLYTTLVKDKDSGDYGILMVLKDKPVGFVVLKFNNYRISGSETRLPPKNYVKWDGPHELYQIHGDHHAPFVDDKDLAAFLKEMMRDSKVCLALSTEVNFDGNEISTRVASLKYKCNFDVGDIAYLALIAYNPKNGTNEFISCYPYLKGKPTEVEILDVLEWDNQLEATIKCKYCTDDDEEFVFHFFATDYYFNKGIYKIGAKINVALAASSGNVKEASKGFSFEGQKAIDFLAKLGKKPTYNKDGEVEPIKISTENLVAFLPHDDKCPDMAEFQSPTHDLDYDSIYTNGVNICYIKLNTDTNLEVPLYFNEGFDPKNGEPITGWLWLSGRICDINEAESVDIFVENLNRAKTTEAFIRSLRKFKCRSIFDASCLFYELTDLLIPDGKGLLPSELATNRGIVTSFLWVIFLK